MVQLTEREMQGETVEFRTNFHHATVTRYANSMRGETNLERHLLAAL
jgi:hypothetical protein